MRSIPSVPAMNPLLEQGIAERRRGNDRYAIECFTAALQKEADCVAAYACRAESYFALSEQGRALADINRALALDPKNAVFYALRGNIYSVMEDTVQALADYDKAVALDPKESLFYFRRALLCLLTKPEAALKDLDKTLELQPNVLPAYVERARIHRRRGDHSKAIEDFTAAFLLSGRDAVWLPTLQELLALCDTHIAASPNNAGHYRDRYRLRLVLGDIAGALGDLNEEIRCEPRSATPLIDRAALRYQQKDYWGTLADTDAALLLEQRNGDLYWNRALALFALGRIQDAKNTLDIGIAKTAEHAGLRYLRGRLLRLNGFVTEALPDINEAIRLAPENPLGYEERYLIYAARTDWYRAANDAEAAARLEPTPERLYLAGYSLCNQNRWVEAIPFLDAALAADPDHANARTERERIRHRMRI